MKTYPGAVCVDCLMMIANGDDSGIEDVAAWEAGVNALNATENGKYDVVVTGEESYFSWSSCDYCGSKLGGDRTDVAFIER